MLSAGAWRSMGSCLSAAWNGSRDLGIKKMRVYLGMSGDLKIKEWNVDNN